MSCTGTIPSAVAFVGMSEVEAAESTVKFGVSQEGSVLLGSWYNDLVLFLLQDNDDSFEAKLAPIKDYSDGYGIELKYSFS